jgi:hypothetical protein
VSFLDIHSPTGERCVETFGGSERRVTIRKMKQKTGKEEVELDLLKGDREKDCIAAATG